MQGTDEDEPHRVGGQLETSLQALQDQLGEAARALKAATQALRKAEDAARAGNLREPPRLIEAAAITTEAYLELIKRTEQTLALPRDDYLASPQFLAEVQSATEKLGVQGVRVLDGRLYCYPTILRVEPR